MEKQIKEKMNLSFSPDIKDYLIFQSEAFGMSVSAFLTMLVSNYRQQTVALSTMSDLSTLVSKMEKLVEKNEQTQIFDKMKEINDAHS